MTDRIDHAPPTLGLRLIPLCELHEWPDNPRKTHDPAKHAELVESLRAKGLLQPLLVRPLASGWEVVAGNRRRRGLLEVVDGDALIPCLVRDLTDDDALAAALKENGDRDGLAPLEEAQAFADLAKRNGVREAAALVGKPEQYVRQRLRLLDLCPVAQEFLAVGGLSVGGALVLAQLRDHGDQCSALEQAGYAVDEAEGPATERLPIDGLPTLSQWRYIVSGLGRRLSRAPFPVALAVLTPAGACTACPQRSDAQGALFADATEGVCLNRKCWDEKVLANDRRILDEAERNGRLLTLDKTSKIWASWGERPNTLPGAEWQAIDGGTDRVPVELTAAQRKQVRVAVDSNGHAREVIPLRLLQEIRDSQRAAAEQSDDGTLVAVIVGAEAKAKREAAEEAARKARADKMAEEAKAKELRKKIAAAVDAVIAAADMHDEGIMTALAVAAVHAADAGAGPDEAALNNARALSDDGAARFVLKALLDLSFNAEAASRDILAALDGESYDDIVERITNPPKKGRKRAGTAASARAEQEGGAA